MFLTVSFNPALDKTLFVPDHTPGTTIRATRVVDLAGGKGVNVARALLELGAEVRSLAPLGGHSGAHLAELAAAEGIPMIPTPVRGQTRTALTMVVEGERDYLHYLEPGPRLEEAEIAALRRAYLAALPGVRTVVLSGSLPSPAAAPLPAWMIRAAVEAGCRVALDSFGPLGGEALRAGAWFVKPTADEWASTTGEALRSDADTWAALEQLARWGTRMGVVTLGGRGALALLDGVRYHAVPPEVRVVNDLGAGDSFAAGFCWAAGEDLPPVECLRWATACGAVNVGIWDPGRLVRSEVERLLPLVRIRAA